MHDILLCLDANDSTMDSSNKGLEQIINETTIIDLHHHQHPHINSLATHNHRSHTIDYCLRMNGFVQALTGTWMLPFRLPVTLSGVKQWDLSLIMTFSLVTKYPPCTKHTNGASTAMHTQWFKNSIMWWLPTVLNSNSTNKHNSSQ